jgi:hypothetical protein
MITVRALPRVSMTWEEFVATTPRNSIALDGVVLGGPRCDHASGHFNLDHHDGVVREATMSTTMQALFAIKGGLMKRLDPVGVSEVTIYINDTDQDTSSAVWLLVNHKRFEGVQSLPNINRLLSLTDKWDITAGAFPMNLDDRLVRQHCWVFRPYTDLRKSGALAQANERVMLDNLAAVMDRLDKFMMGQAGEVDLDTRHVILYDSPKFKVIDEIGGNEARYLLYCQGMDAFISIVARRPDGRLVCTVGRRSQHIDFPVPEICDDFNAAEGLNRRNGWNGSDIVIGSSRLNGTGLSWEQQCEITDARLRKNGIIK